ncbi:Vacuolar protein-sorting-associated protein 36 [Hypsibius exemplaris]|uniref:Vacuolar protein-sorting-associated protein 36 n=1 Tax=Hypsibius exemplaris TaxID=2072580 RepID=A0A1W0WMJ5_HYPEX|nr:Vacuolar protein-sorting-associated protein 36 [Hypsibius exemplaris]
MIWVDDNDQSCSMRLHLSLVVLIEEQRHGAGNSPKIMLHLAPPRPSAISVQVSSASHLKFSFRKGGMVEFSRRLTDQIARKRWQNFGGPQNSAGQSGFRIGIAGIERKLQTEQKGVNQQISHAFEDLNSLMKAAKDTVALSKILVTKVKNRQGEITDDETTQLKSYLLSLGVDDPVTREASRSDNIYFQKLAKEISANLTIPLKESGGLMTLTDVYCRVNRARGLELVSPEDVLRACRLMKAMRLPTELKIFESGVIALELRDFSETVVIKKTQEALEVSPLTADMLAKTLGVSVILAKEMLLLAEKQGVACRDESIEGLKFYPNRFLST